MYIVQLCNVHVWRTVFYTSFKHFQIYSTVVLAFNSTYVLNIRKTDRTHMKQSLLLGSYVRGVIQNMQEYLYILENTFSRGGGGQPMSNGDNQYGKGDGKKITNMRERGQI